MGQVEVATLLLVRGADHNSLRFDGRTPLLIAEHNGHGEVVALLLDRGAD
jgi:ankyrin repeat protein